MNEERDGLAGFAPTKGEINSRDAEEKLLEVTEGRGV